MTEDQGYTAKLTAAEYEMTAEKIRRINDRAAKRGWTGGFDLSMERLTETTKNEFGFEITATWCVTTIIGHAPSYGDWVFEAELTWDPEAGLITRPAPGVETIDRSGLREGACDHCGINRDRRKVYLVRHIVTGETRQVGSTCIKDFLGWDGRFVFIPAKNASFDDGFGCGGEGFGGQGEPFYSTDTILAVAWGAMRAYGYHRGDGTDGTPTRTIVSIVLSPNRRSQRELDMAAAIRPYADQSLEQAAIIKAFLLSDQ
jgi:hypothetical protein